MNTVSSMTPKVFGQVKDLEESYEEVEDLRIGVMRIKKFIHRVKTWGLVKNKGSPSV